MKILQVNDFGYSLGGAEKQFFNIKKGLMQRGHEIFNISSSCAIDGKKIATDFRILESGHCFNLDSYFNVVNYFQFKKILEKFDPDIVQLHNIFYILSPSILFALKKYKAVMLLHDYYIICMRDKTFPNLEICSYPLGPVCRKKKCVSRLEYITQKIIRRDFIIRSGIGNIDVFISPSEYLKKEFEKNGITNVRVLHNSLGFENIQPLEFKDSNTLLYIGRLARQKGVDFLLKAMAVVTKKHPDIILKIMGTGPEEDYLKKLTNDLNINNNVNFLGFMEGEKKLSVIKEALITIAPSVWPENDSSVKYEAAIYGKATIATNVGGNPEFIQEGKTGFLVAPKNINDLANKILYVLDNKNILIEMRENIVNKIQDYKLDKYLERLELIYREVIEKDKKGI